MYTIKHAAELVGITTATLRAWERRYGVVGPERTDGGYRVYSDEDVRVLRAMRALVDEGWRPSLAAKEARARVNAPVLTLHPGQGAVTPDAELIGRFLSAAAALDASGLSAALDELFSLGSFEAVVEQHLFPALDALGEAWADGRVSVAGEHFASHAVMRRVAAAYEAAGSTSSGPRVLLGLAPGCRHELGLFAFAVAARRRGLATDYLGADLPLADWVAACSSPAVAAIVLAVPHPDDLDETNAVVAAIRRQRPDVLVAVGGSEQDHAREGVLRLGHDIAIAAQTLATEVAAARSSGRRSTRT